MFIVRALAVWFVIMGVEFTHGAVRAILLSPRIGDFPARQLGVFTGSLLIVGVAFLFIRWIRAQTKAALVLVGFIWLVLTVGFEVGFGRFVFERSWEELASDYNLLEGGLLPIGLVVLTLSPLIAARLRGLHKQT